MVQSRIQHPKTAVACRAWGPRYSGKVWEAVRWGWDCFSMPVEQRCVTDRQLTLLPLRTCGDHWPSLPYPWPPETAASSFTPRPVALARDQFHS